MGGIAHNVSPHTPDVGFDMVGIRLPFLFFVPPDRMTFRANPDVGLPWCPFVSASFTTNFFNLDYHIDYNILLLRLKCKKNKLFFM